MILAGARILLDDGLVDGQALVLEAGRIVSVQPAGRVEVTMQMPPGSILAPGFIDVQVNGGGGVLLNDAPDRAGMARIAAAHRRFGTTGLLPTLITDRPDAMQALAAACAAPLPPGVLGVHLEGPFISPDRPGIHDPACIRAIAPPDIALLTALAARCTVLLTLAPETVPDCVLAQLAVAGVILSAGHTTATPERLATAIGAGLRGFTHLFNAMPPLAGRAPGPAGAALLADDAWCGIIADGVHVHPDLLRLAIRAKPPGKIMLVTDAMPPLGTDLPGFTLGGRPILREAGRLVGPGGTLAGADLDMAQAVRNTVHLLGMDVAEALRMASLYPARFLRMDGTHGRIAPGLQADLVLLSPDLQVLGTWLGGAWQDATTERSSLFRSNTNAC